MEKKTFSEMCENDFRALGRSLQTSMTLGDILFLPSQIGQKTDDEIAEIVAKMNQTLLPVDYSPSQNRSLLMMACRFAF